MVLLRKPHWAQKVRASFPDGQLFLDLGAHPDSGTWTPAYTLARLLADLGVPASGLPAELSAKISLYRTLVARQVCLLVLDDAPSSKHVRAFVPPPGKSMLVVTSRHRLEALTTHHAVRAIDLDVMSTEESAELLSRVIGAGRAAREPAEIRRLAELCGHWPLAVRIAAARLAAGHWPTVASLAEEVSGAYGLRALQVEERGVQEALAETARSLSSPAVRLLHLLARLAADPDLGRLAAATGMTEPAAAKVLAELAAARLTHRTGAGAVRLAHLPRLWALRTKPPQTNVPLTTPTAQTNPPILHVTASMREADSDRDGADGLRRIGGLEAVPGPTGNGQARGFPTVDGPVSSAGLW